MGELIQMALACGAGFVGGFCVCYHNIRKHPEKVAGWAAKSEVYKAQLKTLLQAMDKK